MLAGGQACASARRRGRCRRGRRARGCGCSRRRYDPIRAASAGRRDRRGARRRRPARGVRGRPDVDRRDPERQEQVEEHRLGTGALLRAEPTVVEVVDELAEQRADGDRRRGRPVDRAAERLEVDGAEDSGAGCPRLVHRAGGDPERPRRWQDVAAAALGEHDEHSLGRPRELVVGVCVPLEACPDRHREGADDRRRSRLSVHRHNLAAYSLSETDQPR